MKKLSIVLIIIGVLVAVSPLAGKLYTQYQENKMMIEWLNSSDADAADTNQATADPNEAYGQLQDAFSNETDSQTTGETQVQSGEASETDVSGQAATPQKASQQKILGVITIDKLKMKFPIVEGVKAENLRAGIGHIPGTAAIGQPGNCALAGHRNYTFGKFFNRLDEIKIGDKVVLSTKTGDYRYVVYEKLVVKPSDVSVLKGSKDDNIITLITCTPIYIATHRLIVHARLESQSALNP